MNDHKWTRHGIQFACNAEKRVENLRKHNLDMVDAVAAFFDPMFISDYDAEHSDYEDRYGLIGKMGNGKLVMVSCAFRDDVTRIISARKATPKEKRLYDQQS
jgi:uncharacterized DUF497 family protein